MPPRRGVRQSWHHTWWTRDRVMQALLRFYHDYGLAPLSTAQWHARVNQGRATDHTGKRRPYPSFASILKYFGTFRQAWAAVGVEVDRTNEAWSATDEWYLREAVGILTRNEIARDLNRSPDAVHRRLYDLGLNVYDRWGWTLNRLERATQVPRHVFERYMSWGALPYFRGSKSIYVDPGDLTVVQELDFEHLSPELEEAMQRSLRGRLVKVLAGADWRAGRVWQPHQEVNRPYNRRDRTPPTPRPTGIHPGDWVRVVEDVPRRPQLLDRIGLVQLVYWATQRTGNSIRVDTVADWYARVEFKSQHTRSRGPRVTYSLPVEYLTRAMAPNLKVRCRCNAIIVTRPDVELPDTCSFCKAPLERSA